MAGKLAGKVAVVTGAGSEVGIGKETAKAMAAEGARVVVNDIGKDPDGTMGADRVVKEIEKAGGTAVANYDSVTSMEGGVSIIKTAIDNFGRIDILVNTAGNYISNPTLDYTERDWDAIIAVHLKGLFACTQAALKEMIRQKSGGRIINITSSAAWPRRFQGSTADSTAKAGVLGFSRALSGEMQQYNINVNAISLGAETKLLPQAGDAGPEYVVPLIVYLATDAAKEITGQIFFAGGGAVMVFSSIMNPPWGKSGAHQHLHKKGKWTIDELIKIMPKMVHRGETD
jgi:NAD(P)-dependent dehydrogenase (short-subunit alcohol dehydrogenase family)